MNDHHYTSDTTRVSPLFFEHPESCTRGGKGLSNYARPEVREHYLKPIVEVLDRGADGIYLFNHFQSVNEPLRLHNPAGRTKSPWRPSLPATTALSCRPIAVDRKP